jgi:hypothetical protein
LFAVWAGKSDRTAEAYIGQIHFLLDIIEQTPLSEFTIVAGDFNSNSIWDAPDGVKNHSAAVERFRKLGLESSYHVFSGDSQGAEQYPTHWNMKKKTAAYHIDYAFLSRPIGIEGDGTCGSLSQTRRQHTTASFGMEAGAFDIEPQDYSVRNFVCGPCLRAAHAKT